MTRHLHMRDAFPFLRCNWRQSNVRTSIFAVVRYASTIKRQRRDDIWIPTISLKKQDGVLDATELLTRAGYIRQAYSGIYHMLPLGLKVQNKLEALIDKHMTSIQASKVSLSSISSQSLWGKSGRLSTGSEFFKFADRKDGKWLLAPTHEEEITQLVGDVVHSASQLPIRLYQVSRKYRDEKRPRGGLLRGREFIMKDLYTFDVSQVEAQSTYDQVRQAYRNFLSELKIDYVEARADSGNMGGTLSHEYHFPSTSGEDDVIHCSACDYARNEEWVPDSDYRIDEVTDLGGESVEIPPHLESESFVDRSKTTLVKVYAPSRISNGQSIGMNTHAVKAAVKSHVELDTGIEQAHKAFEDALRSSPSSKLPSSVYYLFDDSIPVAVQRGQLQRDEQWIKENNLSAFLLSLQAMNDGSSNSGMSGFPLLRQASGDSCPQCGTGTLIVDKAIEVGHTFHLGTRYSSKLGLTIKNSTHAAESTPVEMGCHGVGVSRLIAAVAASLSDSVGLNWPAVIAPFHAVIIVDGSDKEKASIAQKLYDSVTRTKGTVDILLDDRVNVGSGYKLKDADLIGYPIIIIIGRTWQQNQKVELQCRRLGIKENLDLEQVQARVTQLLEQI